MIHECIGKQSEWWLVWKYSPLNRCLSNIYTLVSFNSSPFLSLTFTLAFSQQRSPSLFSLSSAPSPSLSPCHSFISPSLSSFLPFCLSPPTPDVSARLPLAHPSVSFLSHLFHALYLSSFILSLLISIYFLPV